MKNREVDPSWEKVTLPDGGGIRFTSPTTVDSYTGVETTFTKQVTTIPGLSDQAFVLARRDEDPYNQITRALSTITIFGQPIELASFAYPLRRALTTLSFASINPQQITLSIEPETGNSRFSGSYSLRRRILQEFQVYIPLGPRTEVEDRAEELRNFIETDPEAATQKLCDQYQDKGPAIFYPVEIDPYSTDKTAFGIAHEYQKRKSRLDIKFQRWGGDLQSRQHSYIKHLWSNITASRLGIDAPVFSDHFALQVLEFINPNFNLKSVSEQEDDLTQAMASAIATILYGLEETTAMLGDHQAILVRQKSKSKKLAFIEQKTKQIVEGKKGAFIDPFQYYLEEREFGELVFLLKHFRRPDLIKISLPEHIAARRILAMSDEDSFDWLELPGLLQPLHFQKNTIRWRVKKVK